MTRTPRNSASCCRTGRISPAPPITAAAPGSRSISPISTSTSCRSPTITIRPPPMRAPSRRRSACQAMFDWWERLFDYTVSPRRHPPPARPPFLASLRRGRKDAAGGPGAAARRDRRCAETPRPLGLRYFAGPDSRRSMPSAAPISRTSAGASASGTPTAGSAALECRFRRERHRCGAAGPLGVGRSRRPRCRRDGETGNANLRAFVDDGCLENGEPRRYDDLRRLNDGLRRARARCARRHGSARSTGWRCPGPRAVRQMPARPERPPAARRRGGLCERASRIEEAISAVQAFVRRARLRSRAGMDRHAAASPSCGTANLRPSRCGGPARNGSSTRRTGSSGTTCAGRSRSRRSASSKRSCANRSWRSPRPAAATGGPTSAARIRHDPDLLQVREPSRMAAAAGPARGARPPRYAGMRRPAVLAGAGSCCERRAATAPSRPRSAAPAAARHESSIAAMDGGGDPARDPLLADRGGRHAARRRRDSLRTRTPAPPTASRCCEDCGCEHPPLPRRVLFLAGRRRRLRAGQ